jgi:HSP20 family protein
MTSLIPWKSKKQRRELASCGNGIGPVAEFTFSINRMRDEFDRLLDRMANDFSGVAGFDGWGWGLEVEDQDNAIVVRAEAPGFDAGDFDLRVDDGQLNLHVAKKAETKTAKGELQEYSEEECFESVTLPAGIDKDKVKAEYQNGVLTVTLPKTAASKAKRIAVKTS